MKKATHATLKQLSFLLGDVKVMVDNPNFTPNDFVIVYNSLVFATKLSDLAALIEEIEE